MEINKSSTSNTQAKKGEQHLNLTIIVIEMENNCPQVQIKYCKVYMPKFYYVFEAGFPVYVLTLTY